VASFFVTVAFDLKDATSADYQCAEENLRTVGLQRTVSRNDGSKVELPYNTFARLVNGETAAKVCDDVMAQAKTALNKCRVSGRMFVSVGGNWAWNSTSI
jgi:hypothetical protein